MLVAVDDASPVPVESVLDLLAHLDDPNRRLPVVIISIGSRASRHGVPPSRLARELAGRATVWALPTPQMSRHLGARPELETYGGAVRVVGRSGWSTVIRTDRTDRGAETAIRRIAQAVVDATAADPTRPKLALVPSPSPEPEPAQAVDRDETSRLEREIQRLRRALTSAQQEVRDLRAERQQETQPTRAATDPVVFADEEQQLRFEVEQSWLRQVAECDREQYPLRRYAIGARFLEGVATTQAPRQRVVAIMVDVLTRRAYYMPARRVHPHSEHRGGAQLTRPDNACAYRAAVKDHTPGAPRLLWWENVDGTAEFAWVGHHGDPMPNPRKA